ncbi:hypothetical protein LL033_17295 [Clostridium estertheticum]|uniref:hypothetical protein n=1 Tax=Clostridium estertheticum TaxID=238834 RepID=UPI001C0E1939|nr:hypothetical protein [Clostridium estertheticum]MBU3216675.1 hypothetical protein [Clostridium estertheticum]WAG54369.1 hypothetical protein LL033_17295 [Clostridium estertheticum]
MNHFVLINESDMEISKENELIYKKLFLHMMNDFLLSEGAITQEIFEKAKMEIEKMNKV